MDEDIRPALTAQGLQDLENGTVLDDEETFVMRCIQSAEALERPYRTEEELQELLEWYQGVQADFLLAKMVVKGNIFLVEMTDDGPTYTSSPQGRKIAADLGLADAEELPALD